MFENNELKSSGWCKPSPNRNKTPVYCENSFIARDFCKCMEHIIVDFLVFRLVHQPCAHHIKRSYCNCHEEACNECAHSLQQNTFSPVEGFFNYLLCLIVYSHLNENIHKYIHTYLIKSLFSLHTTVSPYIQLLYPTFNTSHNNSLPIV